MIDTIDEAVLRMPHFSLHTTWPKTLVDQVASTWTNPHPSSPVLLLGHVV